MTDGTDIPLRADGPRRRFYGWRMVALCSITYGLSAPGQTPGISVFIDPIIDTLGLSRSEVSTAYLIGTLLSAATMPSVGKMVDRRGPRAMMLLAGGVFGVALAGAAGVTGLLTLTLAFTFLRVFGQGTLPLVSTTAIAPWFRRRRGFAIAVVAAIGSTMTSSLPIASAWSIRAIGWRGTWLAYAGLIWFVVLPIAVKGIVDHPEALGQRPDGDLDDARGRASESRECTRASFTRRAALRTPMFWAIAGGMGTASAITTGLNFHQIDLLGEQGLAPIEAAANFLPQTVGVLLATLAVGAAIDRVADRWILVAGAGLLTAAMMMVRFVTPGLAAIVYGLLLGTASTTIRTLEASSTPRLYGLQHLGAIRGLFRFVVVASSALGPLVVAAGREAAGSYGPVLTMLVLAPVAVVIFALVVPVPVPREER